MWFLAGHVFDLRVALLRLSFGDTPLSFPFIRRSSFAEPETNPRGNPIRPPLPLEWVGLRETARFGKIFPSPPFTSAMPLSRLSVWCFPDGWGGFSFGAACLAQEESKNLLKRGRVERTGGASLGAVSAASDLKPLADKQSSLQLRPDGLGPAPSYLHAVPVLADAEMGTESRNPRGEARESTYVATQRLNSGILVAACLFGAYNA